MTGDARAPRPHEPGPGGDRLEPVRRARRGDQHHAADLHGAGVRGDPPRAQPVGRRGGRRGGRGGRAGRRGVVYQGGHVEYFEYLVESLRERGAGHVKVVGGGGGVIVHDEIERLRASGVTIFSPEDGQRMGLPGMINSVVRELDVDLWEQRPVTADAVLGGDRARRRPGDHRRRARPRPRGRPDARSARRRRGGTSRSSASPAPAARASPASPTSSYAGSGSTSRTSCGSPWWPSTRPGARAAARCSATGSG